jgi:hypothetical protein
LASPFSANDLTFPMDRLNASGDGKLGSGGTLVCACAAQQDTRNKQPTKKSRRNMTNPVLNKVIC